MNEPIPDPDGPFPREFGRYELTRRLGRGAMGTVYLAHDRELDLAVALKVPHPDVLIKPIARERFRREARAAARLAHPNLAWALDVNQCRGVDYLAMRYVPDSPRSGTLLTADEVEACFLHYGSSVEGGALPDWTS